MQKIHPGQVIAKFKSKKGKEIELRIPKKSDAQEYLDFINSIIAEDDYILFNKPVTDLKAEKKWVGDSIKNMIDKKAIMLTAFYQNKIIGNMDVNVARDREEHIGSFGIVMKDGFRHEGIGTKMMKIMFDEAKKLGVKIVVLEVFANNIHTVKCYEKIGFVKHGQLPKAISWRGKYIDGILMYKNL